MPTKSAETRAFFTLSSSSWEKVADVVAMSTDRTATVMDPRSGGAARFYRVVTPRRP